MSKPNMMLCGCMVLALAACGGGSDSAPAPEPAQETVEYVPAAASGGISVFAGWLKQMQGQPLDNKDSLNTSTFAPTLQDDTEPVPAPL